jgi:hypothetical protein
MGVFYLEYCCLRMPHQSYFTQRGLYQIVVAYIATQHAQHAVRRQFRYPTSPPTLGVPKVNSSNWPNCSSQAISLSLTGAELFAADSQSARHQQLKSHATSLANWTNFKASCLWGCAYKILQHIYVAASHPLL